MVDRKKTLNLILNPQWLLRLRGCSSSLAKRVKMWSMRATRSSQRWRSSTSARMATWSGRRLQGGEGRISGCFVTAPHPLPCSVLMSQVETILTEACYGTATLVGSWAFFISVLNRIRPWTYFPLSQVGEVRGGRGGGRQPVEQAPCGDLVTPLALWATIPPIERNGWSRH